TLCSWTGPIYLGIQGRLRRPAQDHLHRLLGLKDMCIRRPTFWACVVLALASLGGTASANHSRGQRHAVLGEGRIGKFSWTSSIRSISGRPGGVAEPCVSAVTEEGTRISELTQCGEVRQ